MMDATIPPQILPAIIGAFADAGITPLVLRRPQAGYDSPTAHQDRQVRIMVLPTQARGACAVLERLPWRYSWQRTGLMRLLPSTYYWWDGGADLELCWGDSAAPLPVAALGGVTAALWSDPTRTAEGYLEPDPAALLVHLAVQAGRPGPVHGDDWAHFMRCLSAVDDRARADRIAREAGVASALRRALAAADLDGRRPTTGRIFDGPLQTAWRAAHMVRARMRPERFQRVLAGAPALGDATMRCRVAGVEVLAGPGVFVPTPDADVFVELATTYLAGVDAPVIVEIGTGCGAIALAVAKERPEATVHATDLFPSAVRWSRRNATRLGLPRVRFHQGSVLEPVPRALAGRVDLMIANLPFYPASGFAPIGSVPRETIQGGGDDGLALVRALVREARSLLRPRGRLLLQMFATQWATFTSELAALGYRVAEPQRIGPFVIGPADRDGA
jgi:methylase of polypeptide subunit release factors